MEREKGFEESLAGSETLMQDGPLPSIPAFPLDFHVPWRSGQSRRIPAHSALARHMYGT